MENFTDIFGEDLSSLEGLSDFSHFGGNNNGNAAAATATGGTNGPSNSTNEGPGEGGASSSSSSAAGPYPPYAQQKMYNNDYPYRHPGYYPPPPPAPGGAASSASPPTGAPSPASAAGAPGGTPSSQQQQQYMRPFPSFGNEPMNAAQTPMGWNAYGSPMGHPYRPGYRQPYPDRQSHYPRPHVPHGIPPQGTYPGQQQSQQQGGAPHYPAAASSSGLGRYPSPKGAGRPPVYPPYGDSFPDYGGLRGSGNPMHNRASSPMYRSPFPPNQPPGAAKSSSTPSNPISPATSSSSSSPAGAPTNNLRGSSPRGSQGSLQQLEQMVMPSPKEPARSPSASSANPKPPHSPSVHSQNNPLSPQTWSAQQQQAAAAAAAVSRGSNAPGASKQQQSSSNGPQSQKLGGMPGMHGPQGMAMGGMGGPMPPRSLHPGMMMDRGHMGMRHPGMYASHMGNQGMAGMGAPGMMPHPGMPRGMAPHPGSHMMHAQQQQQQNYQQNMQMSNQYSAPQQQGMPPSNSNPPPSQIAPPHQMPMGSSSQQSCAPQSQQYPPPSMPMNAAAPTQQQPEQQQPPNSSLSSSSSQSVPSSQNSLGQSPSSVLQQQQQQPPSESSNNAPSSPACGRPPSSSSGLVETDAGEDKSSSSLSKPPEINDQVVSQPDRDTSVVTPKLCEEGEYKSDHKDEEEEAVTGLMQQQVHRQSPQVPTSNHELAAAAAEVESDICGAVEKSEEEQQPSSTTTTNVEDDSLVDHSSSNPQLSSSSLKNVCTSSSSEPRINEHSSSDKPPHESRSSNCSPSSEIKPYESAQHMHHSQPGFIQTHPPPPPGGSGGVGSGGYPNNSTSSNYNNSYNPEPFTPSGHSHSISNLTVESPGGRGGPGGYHPIHHHHHHQDPHHLEASHINQQLSHLYTQPQSPIVQNQIKDLQNRLHHLQQQLPPPGVSSSSSNWGAPKDIPPPQQQQQQHSGGSTDCENVVDGDDSSNLEESTTLKKGKKGAKPKKEKVPKEPKTPKEKKPRASKKKKPSPPSEGGASAAEEGVLKFEDTNNENENNKILPENSLSESGEAADNAADAPPILEETPPAAPEKKEKKLKVKNTTPKKPKPNKTLLQFTKKKRKRTDSGSDADLDATPPPSPKKLVDSKEKRRSGRNTQRKKYVDDVDLNLSEEDNILSHLPPDVASQMKRNSEASKGGAIPPGGAGGGQSNEHESSEGPGNAALHSVPENSTSGEQIHHDPSVSGPNYAFVDTLAEDTMVVQIILASRGGSRELESDEEDENMRLVYEDEIKPRDHVVRRRGGPIEKAALAKAAAATLPEERKKALKEIEKKEVAVEPTTKLPKKEEELLLEEPKEEKKETTPPAVEKASPGAAKKDLNPRRMIDVEEFLVKFKNFSYLHCQWLTEEELQRGDKRICQKIRRFKMKREKSGNVLEYTEDEPFNPDYVEVDRVLDYSEHTDPVTNVTTKHFLVKWRSLPYEDCTWELESDVDPLKIQDYELWKNPPPADCFHKKRPRKDGWNKWEVSPVYKNGNNLRPYQLEGVNWLMFSWYNGRNCLLADEMGLGKTIQSLAFLDAIFNYGIRGPFLVIAPLSTIPNWQREFELWSNMNVIVYHGSQTSRNMLNEYEMYHKDENGERIPGVYKFHCLITTYECVITDILELREIKWRACVIDEAHRLKNKNCKLLEGLSLLDLETRLLLSGTPLQNNINELFSLLSFLEPSQFNSQEAFIKEFGDMQNEAQVTKLQALLKPLMLRRMKEDVEKSLKPKEETIVEVELTNMQKKYYRGILEKNFSFLSKGTSHANVPNLMNTMMELRKCCIHPYLLNGAEEQIQEEYRSMHDRDPDGVYFNALTRSSGKMVLLDKLLPKLKEGGHRVLIFSQMVKMLDILEDYLIRKKYSFERIDGRIRGNLRQAAIDRFCRPDSDRFVFLLCTKAGGLGINLVAADTCIIYDSDWNPQNDLQAQARCHRIGQSKMVKIYRLITRNTYEREMFDKASLKLGLDKAVLQSMNTSQGSKGCTEKANTLSKKEIEDLLRKGAYGALMDDENAGDKFCEEDIEEILLRRTTTVTLENEKAGGSFSKASFTSADTADIAIDDPDFWAKWARRAEIEEVDEKTSLMVNEPRSRKKIQRFGGHESLDPQDVSELDSDSDSDSDSKRGRKGRSSKKRRGKDYDDDYMEDERDVVYGSWSKNELFRIEKSLMAFGWGRWEEILIHSNLRKGFNGVAIEDASRMILLYCLNTYKGDEKIKGFIWDLISPYDSSADKIVKNHSGLSGPVPRGNRKNRKVKRERGDDDSVGSSNPDGINWISNEKYDLDTFLDKSYRKHLDRNSNKVLLRVRMLYYLRVEVLGDHIRAIGTPGCSITDLPLIPPPCDGPPAFWWDIEADKSLLIGTYRHGYERYNMMRLDPDLSFLNRCGPPDSADIQEELKAAHSVDPDENSKLDEEEDSLGSKTPSERPSKLEESDSNTGLLRFPSQVDLNGRLRRLISTYQREFKREEARQAAKDKRNEKRERIEQVMRERELHRLDMSSKKWTKKEEVDFLNTLLIFGVECSKDQRMLWDRFRHISKLDRKSDDTLNEYYVSLIGICKKILGKSSCEEDAESNLQNVSPDILSDERAKKVFFRMELFRKLREEIILDENLDKKLELCDLVQDLPEWWIPGYHDKDLLLGVARHGINRMEYYVLNDPELSFKDIVQRHSKGQSLVDEKNMELFKERKAKQKEEADKKSNDDAEEEDNNEGSAEEKVKGEDNGREGGVKTPTKASNGDEQQVEDQPRPEKRKGSLTISPPTLSQMEQMAKGGLLYDIEMMNELMAQSYAAAIKWPKDQVLKARLDQVIDCVESEVWSLRADHALGDHCDPTAPLGVPLLQEEVPLAPRDTATPLSESGLSETSTDDNPGKFNKRHRVGGVRRGGLLGSTETIATTISTDVDKSKIRSLLGGLNDDLLPLESRLNRPNLEVSSVNGDSGCDPLLDLKKHSSSKGGSKLESALDKIGLAKRKLSDDNKEDKTKKKKRLDDIMFGLGAAKGVSLDKNGSADTKSKSAACANDDSLKAVAAVAAAAASGKVTDLNKLQDILTPLAGSPAEAKVQKWLADQMGVVPERPITPSAATATSTSFSKSPKSGFSSNPMEWMSNVSGDEHVTVFNRITGKKLSGTAGPKLKFLAQWLIDNPMFEVDPKWAEVVKSREPNPGDKRKGGGRSEGEPGAKKLATSGVGPSFSTSGMLGLGLDPKNPMSSLSALDPKNPLSLSALYGIDPKKLDPVTAAMLGFGDPKNPMKMDPMMMAAMGLDAKTLQAMGIDQKMLQSMGLDPKMFQQPPALDPKVLQSMGLDPKLLQSMGLDPKVLQSMGLDPKVLASMGLDAKVLQSMGLDQKTLAANMGLDPKTSQASSSSNLDSKMMQSMGLDPKLMQSMGLDPKIIQSLGMDPRMLQALAMDPKVLQQAMSADPKLLQSMGIDPKLLQSLSMDPKMLQAMGLDPKLLASMDPKILQSLGIDPKTMNLDPKMLQSMGMDPKMFQSMGIDPKAAYQAMGLDPKMLQSLGLDQKSLQAMGLDPKMLQSMGMDPKTLQAMGMDPKTLQAMGIDPKTLQAMGMDPKMLQSMGLDPKMLQSMGLDPKMLQSMGLDPKTLQSMGMDPKTLQAMGMDPKTLQAMGMDPKTLQAMGIDPKTLQAMGMDPKTLQAMGMDPKSFQNMGVDPKLAQSLGLDPKMLQMMGIDQKTLQAMAMDPKSLQAMGIDPKIIKNLGLDPKSTQQQQQQQHQQQQQQQQPMGMDPKMLASLGLDAKSLQNLSSMDPKILQSMGIDPKMFDPKVLQSMGIDIKMPPSSSSEMPKTPKTDSPRTSGHKSSSEMGGFDLKKMDPSILMALGIDPKNPKIDPVTLSALGLDPKNPNLMAALAMMDPNQLSSLYSYGMMNPGAFMGMDMGGGGGSRGHNNRTPTPVSKESVKSSAPSPRGSRASPSPRPPSRASVKSDVDRRSPRTSVPSSMSPKPGGGHTSMAPTSIPSSHAFGGMDPKMLQAAGIDPKSMSSLDPKLFGMDPRFLGLGGFDPKALASMDPKLLQAAGIDMKMLQALDPKLFAGMDPKLLAAGMDPKLLAAGMDPKLLAGIDPKLLAGMDPKLLTGIDPKFLAGMDPKFLAGLDPKFLAGMDPKQFLGGLDPKMLGLDPKMFGLPDSTKGTSSFSPKATSSSSIASSLAGSLTSSGGDPRLLGLDLKMLQGLDSKALQRLGLDPKLVASLLNGVSSAAPSGSKPPTAKSMSGKTSTISTYSSLDPRMFPGFDPKLMSAYGLDPKLLSSMDPKLLAGLDPKLLGFDPKMLAGYDPKVMGMDPKLLGLDPKTLSSMDPKLLASFGLDPKMLAGMDPKLLASIDPKALSDPKLLAALDPKLLGGIDPKLLDPKNLANLDPKILGFDPKSFLAGMDPNLVSMYAAAAGFPPSNGVSPPTTSKQLGASGSTCKPKPGTVAAALAEKKKEAAAAQSSNAPLHQDTSDSESLKSAPAENTNAGAEEAGPPPPPETPEEQQASDEEAEKFETRKGLTSEERVLLREKKRERLMKEKDSSDSGDSLENASSKKKGSKLESVLDKLVDSRSEEQQQPSPDKQ